MSAIETVLTGPAAVAVGRALLQFVWQGALIGAITALAFAALRRSAADIRYVVGTIGLSLMLTVPVVGAVQSWRAAGRADGAPAGAPGDVLATPAEGAVAATALPEAVRGSGPEAAPETSAAPVQRASDPWMRIVVLGWLCGVAMLTLRLVSGWLWVQRMKSRATMPAAASVQEIAARLRRRLHIGRGVRFLDSPLVEVPTVIGWLKPVVLMPACALGALSPQQLEAIIAHELAHIRRHDYLVNLLQTLVETLLFYHPAVWWLSRRIRIEREHCCDDLAVSLCGDPVTYARALAELEGQRAGASLALAASGGSLLQRVRRLLGAPTHAGRGPGWLAGTAAVLLIVSIAAGAVSRDVEQVQPAPVVAAAPAAQAAQPVRPAAEASVAAEAAAALHAQVQAALAGSAQEAQVRAVEMAEQVSLAHAALAGQVRALEENAAVLALAAEAARATAVIADVEGRAAAIADAGAALATAAATVVEGVPAIAAAGAGQSGNFTWSNGSDKIQVNYSGAIEFTDDDTDVKSISPGGFLKIREGGLFGARTVEFRAAADGTLERRFWVGSSEKPFEPEGRQWLSQALPRFIRQTGLGAPARVARIFRARGVDGVLEEIALIEGSWARRVYYAELLKADALDERAVERILARAGRDLESDFELASLLIGSADRLLVGDAVRKAYFDAARTIDSDFEMRRVYSSALKKGPVSPELLAGLLDASLSIEGDFESASLLLQIAKLQPLDARSRAAFFKALDGVESDFERRRVLAALVSAEGQPAETLEAVLGSALGIESDFELASLLLAVVKGHSIEGQARTAFFRAVDSIDSPFERGRVLQAVARRSDASADTIVDVLRAAGGMRSGFELSQVLLSVAATHPLKGQARELYIDAAERLGEFEQGRALSALVKNERGSR